MPAYSFSKRAPRAAADALQSCKSQHQNRNFGALSAEGGRVELLPQRDHRVSRPAPGPTPRLTFHVHRDGGIRTRDLTAPSRARYQTAPRPVCTPQIVERSCHLETLSLHDLGVRAAGLEPATSPPRTECATRSTPHPEVNCRAGIEPAWLGLQPSALPLGHRQESDRARARTAT